MGCERYLSQGLRATDYKNFIGRKRGVDGVCEGGGREGGGVGSDGQVVFSIDMNF